MFEGKFWKATAERGIKSAAQALLLYWGGDAVFNAWHADWPAAGGIASGALVLSVLTSLVSVKAGDPDSPSLVPDQL
ncbi:holin [Micromonospora sp. WMMD998]|uniref:holin n=1 Tax=Micromonospora sp. WMMD998 TaxID=3016092 RepID=UPI00249BC207|nr:holin [Micromonospora sp. WMMD998]WFE41968.1 holin [Micromonospora sp. WMMD998]